MVHMVFMQIKVESNLHNSHARCMTKRSPPHKIVTLIPPWVILSVVFPVF